MNIGAERFIQTTSSIIMLRVLMHYLFLFRAKVHQSTHRDTRSHGGEGQSGRPEPVLTATDRRLISPDHI